jgi:hypothetical protein
MLVHASINNADGRTRCARDILLSVPEVATDLARQETIRELRLVFRDDFKLRRFELPVQIFSSEGEPRASVWIEGAYGAG